MHVNPRIFQVGNVPAVQSSNSYGKLLRDFSSEIKSDGVPAIGN